MSLSFVYNWPNWTLISELSSRADDIIVIVIVYQKIARAHASSSPVRVPLPGAHRAGFIYQAMSPIGASISACGAPFMASDYCTADLEATGSAIVCLAIVCLVQTPCQSYQLFLANHGTPTQPRQPSSSAIPIMNPISALRCPLCPVVTSCALGDCYTALLFQPCCFKFGQWYP